MEQAKATAEAGFQNHEKCSDENPGYLPYSGGPELFPAQNPPNEETKQKWLKGYSK